MWVGQNHGAGVDVTAAPDQVVKYDGTHVVVDANSPECWRVAASELTSVPQPPFGDWIVAKQPQIVSIAASA